MCNANRMSCRANARRSLLGGQAPDNQTDGQVLQRTRYCSALHAPCDSNTDFGLQACADGDSWVALRYMPQFHAWEEVHVTAGQALVDICKQFAGMLPAGPDQHTEPQSKYTGSKWRLQILPLQHQKQCTSVTISSALLLKAYKLWYSDRCADWGSLHKPFATAYTHHPADRRCSSGLGRFRGHRHTDIEQPVRHTAAHAIVPTDAEDVMVQVLPVGSQRRQGRTSTAPCRVAFFFKHEPNQPLSADARSVDEAGMVSWVAVQPFLQHLVGVKREHVRDEASGEHVYTLSNSLEYYPAANIKGHVHMTHWCFFSGDESRACHVDKRGKMQHVAREGQERYLYNDHAHYREEDPALI